MGMPDHNKFVVIKGKWVSKKTQAEQYTIAFLVTNVFLSSHVVSMSILPTLFLGWDWFMR